MGFGYRKRVKLFSGVHLNVSKRGVGLNIGPKGMNITYNSRGTFVNLGIPGTGLYYRSKIGGSKKRGQARMANDGDPLSCFFSFTTMCVFIAFLIVAYHLIFTEADYTPYLVILGCIVLVFIISLFVNRKPKEVNTSQRPQVDKNDLIQELHNLIEGESDAQKVAYYSFKLKDLSSKKEDLLAATSYYNYLPEDIKNAFKDMVKSFRNIKGLYAYSARPWVNKEITSYNKPFEPNANFISKIGGDDEVFKYPVLDRGYLTSIHLFPTCILIHDYSDDNKKITISQYSQINIKYKSIKVISDYSIEGAIFVRTIWEHANSDNSRDKRFNNNKEYYVYKFGSIEIDGFYYIFSDIDGCSNFCFQLEKLKRANCSNNVDFTSIPIIKSVPKIEEKPVTAPKKEGKIIAETKRRIPNYTISNKDKFYSRISMINTAGFSGIMLQAIEMLKDKDIDGEVIAKYITNSPYTLKTYREEAYKIIMQYAQSCYSDKGICSKDKDDIKFLYDIFHFEKGELTALCSTEDSTLAALIENDFDENMINHEDVNDDIKEESLFDSPESEEVIFEDI